MNTRTITVALAGALVSAWAAYSVVAVVTAATEGAQPLTIVQRRGNPMPTRTTEITSTVRSDGSVVVQTVKSGGPEVSQQLRRFEERHIKDLSTGEDIVYYPALGLKVSTPIAVVTPTVMASLTDKLTTCAGDNETSAADPGLPAIFGIDVVKVTNGRHGEECGLLSESMGRSMDSKCVAELWRAPSLDCKILQIRETRSHAATGETDIVKELLYTVEVMNYTRDDLFVVPDNVVEGPPSEVRRRLAEMDDRFAADYAARRGDAEFTKKERLQDERCHKKREIGR